MSPNIMFPLLMVKVSLFHWSKLSSHQWKLGIKRCHPDLTIMVILLSKPFPQAFLDPIHLSIIFLLLLLYAAGKLQKHLSGHPCYISETLAAMLWQLFISVTCLSVLITPTFQNLTPFYNLKLRILTTFPFNTKNSEFCLWS